MTAKEWFKRARDEGWAIGAFNVDNLEIFKAIVMAAVAKKSPVMVQFSPGEVGYFGLRNIIDLTMNARLENEVPILLNLDHGKPKGAVLEAIKLSGEDGSFDNVHFDGSDLTMLDNIHETKEVVELARKKGIIVEGEINKVGGSSEVHLEDLNLDDVKKSYTKPDEAKAFVEETGVDIFSPVVGNLHGTFPVQPDLDIELLLKIRSAIGETFMAMHGGSGIPAVQITRAIKEGGIVKINVNTELRSTYKQALDEEIAENPDEFKIYDLMPDVIRAVAAVVENKIDVFGSAGKA